MLTDSIDTYFIHMCRELLRFITKYNTLVQNLLDSSMYTVLFDSLTENITQDVLYVLRKLNSSGEISQLQMEGMSSFYSGGLLTTLRLFLKRGGPIDETQFIEIVSSFTRNAIRPNENTAAPK